ncbi:MAG: FixH family protein [Deinococcales bacterium]
MALCLGLGLSACKKPASNASATAPASSGLAASSETTPRSLQGLAIRTELTGEAALGEATLLVYVLKDNEAVSGATVNLQGDMSHAGMVPVIAKANEISPGLYQSEGFRFTMAGDWIISTTVSLASGEKHESELRLNVPSK